MSDDRDIFCNVVVHDVGFGWVKAPQLLFDTLLDDVMNDYVTVYISVIWQAGALICQKCRPKKTAVVAALNDTYITLYIQYNV